MNIDEIIGNVTAKLAAAERAEKQTVNAFVIHGHSWQFEMAEMDAHYAREEATAETLRFHTLLGLCPMTFQPATERKE